MQRTMLFGFSLGRVCTMLLEGASEGEFAQFVTNHIFRHKNGMKEFSVMDLESVPNELGSDRRAARPSFDGLFGASFVGSSDLFQEVLVYERAFLN